MLRYILIAVLVVSVALNVWLRIQINKSWSTKDLIDRAKGKIRGYR